MFLRFIFGMLTLALIVSPVRAAVEEWRRLATPDFVLLTSLDEKAAQAWAKEFAQFVAALRSHSSYQGKLSPLTVVVFARERDFARFRPLGENGKPKQMAGFFSRSESWSVAGLSGSEIDEATRRVIFHEGVHWFFSRTDETNPVWLEEGLAEMFSTFTAKKDRAEWGHPIGEHVRLLNEWSPLPLEKLLFTGQSDLFRDDSLRTSIVYAEAWAFVHFLIFGQHDIPRTALADYQAGRRRGEHPDKLFSQAFGRSYAEMDKLFGRYLRGGKYFIRSGPLAAAAAPAITKASAAEVEDALGRLALAARRWDDASVHARALIAAAPDDPRGHEVLALALKGKSEPEAAQVEFERAIAAGSRDFQPFFEVAWAEHQAAVSNGGALDPAAARRIASRYERTINLNPRFLPAYQNLAGVLGVVEPWSDEDRKFIAFGRDLYPEDPMLRIGAAILSYRAGEQAAARAQVDAVLVEFNGRSGPARVFATQVSAAWEQQEVLDRVETLSSAGKFSEALVFVDAQLKQGVAQQTRFQLAALRPQLEAGALSRRIDEATAGQDWKEARRLLAEFLELKIPAALKQQARRTLEQLDRQKLGTEMTLP